MKVPLTCCRLPRPGRDRLRRPGRRDRRADGRRLARRADLRRGRRRRRGRCRPGSTSSASGRASGSRWCRRTPRACSSCSTPYRAPAASWCRSTSGCSSDEVELHRRALRRVGAAGRPRDRRRHPRPSPPSTGSCSARRATRRCCASTASREPWAGVDEDATATINYTSGTTARPKGVQITHRNIWVNAVTFGLHAGVSDWDTYLHTLPMFHANGWGMLYTAAGLGVPQVVLRKVDGTEILRRVGEHDVTFMCAAPAVLNAVLDARAELGRSDPGRRPRRPRDLRRRAAAVEDDRADRGRARLGVLPDLRPDRDLAAADDQPASPRAGRTPITEVSQGPRPRRRARDRRHSCEISDSGEVLARSPTSSSRATGTSPTSRPRRSRAAGSTPATAASIDDDGYLTISDRKKDVIITGGENVSSIEVEDCCSRPTASPSAPSSAYRTRSGARRSRRSWSVRAGSEVTEADLIAHCKQAHRRATRRRPRSTSSRRSRAPRPARSRSSSCASPTGQAATAGQLTPAVQASPIC